MLDQVCRKSSRKKGPYATSPLFDGARVIAPAAEVSEDFPDEAERAGERPPAGRLGSAVEHERRPPRYPLKAPSPARAAGAFADPAPAGVGEADSRHGDERVRWLEASEQAEMCVRQPPVRAGAG